jgi:hypothetical protein
VPVLLVVNVTVPVAVFGVTEAVQVVAVLSRTLAGAQVTAVEVAPWLERTLNDPLLPVWTLSPP